MKIIVYGVVSSVSALYAGDSEGDDEWSTQPGHPSGSVCNDEWSARLPAQWLERDGRQSSSNIIHRRIYLADDAVRAAQ